jgi:chromate transport protein ChrA
MTAILIFGPFFVIPYIMAHIFNRFDYSERWMTYIFSGLANLAYAVLFDLISSYLKENKTQPVCHFPLFLFPLFFSPFLILLQFMFNKAIIESIKHEDDDNEN